MSAPIFEQETIINIPRDENIAYICTSDTTVMTKLDHKVKSNPGEWKLTDQNAEFKFYQCSKGLISYRTQTSKREYTDEQRMEMAQRARDNFK